jgi:hypothetical protein
MAQRPRFGWALLVPGSERGSRDGDGRGPEGWVVGCGESVEVGGVIGVKPWLLFTPAPDHPRRSAGYRADLGSLGLPAQPELPGGAPAAGHGRAGSEGLSS